MTRGPADATGQQGEPVAEMVGDLLDAQRRHPRRSQLQRQRNPIEAETDRTQRGDVRGCDDQAGPGGAGPVREQGQRTELLQLLQSWRVLGPGKRQRRHPPGDLPGHTEAFAACHEDPQFWAAAEHSRHHQGTSRQQVLTVVQDQKPPLRAKDAR